MALLSNRELMTYIESALHRSRDMLEKHGANVAYDCLYYNFTNLFELLEEHQKEVDERLENFKPFKFNQYVNSRGHPFYKEIDNGGAQPV